jgi:hypothetical protein
MGAREGAMGAREGAMGARHRGEKPWWFTPARVLMRIWKSDIRRTLIVRGLHRYVASECRRLLWPDAGGCGVRRRVWRRAPLWSSPCGAPKPCARLACGALVGLLESPVPARAGTRRPRAHGAMVHTSAHAESSSPLSESSSPLSESSSPLSESSSPLSESSSPLSESSSPLSESSSPLSESSSPLSESSSPLSESSSPLSESSSPLSESSSPLSESSSPLSESSIRVLEPSIRVLESESSSLQVA